jgi:rhomboid protease GluP
MPLNQQTPSPPPEHEAPSSQPAGHTRVPVKLPDLTSYVTYIILGITVLIYILQLGMEYLLQSDYLVLYGAKINQRITQGELWRLFTPMFLHGSILHIAFNMYALSKLGPRLERFYGHWRFLAVYFLSGFGGNVFSMMFTDAPSLGSSTAIFGLIGAQGVFYYQNRKIFGSTFRQALNGIITIAAVNLLIGLSPGIDNWGHIGGLIGGTIFAWFSGPLLEVKGVYPNLTLLDQRESSEIVQGIGIVAGFFSLLTAGALYLMQ